jgi:hypothetical protein
MEYLMGHFSAFEMLKVIEERSILNAHQYAEGGDTAHIKISVLFKK